VLQGCAVGRKGSDSLRQAAFEHESERVGELYRSERGVAGAGEGVRIGAVREHAIMQAEAAGGEASRLCVIDAFD
jgi:hypothetical protein